MTEHSARDYNYAACKPVAGAERIRFGTETWLLAVVVAIAVAVLSWVRLIDSHPAGLLEQATGGAALRPHTCTDEHSITRHT